MARCTGPAARRLSPSGSNRNGADPPRSERSERRQTMIVCRCSLRSRSYRTLLATDGPIDRPRHLARSFACSSNPRPGVYGSVRPSRQHWSTSVGGSHRTRHTRKPDRKPPAPAARRRAGRAASGHPRRPGRRRWPRGLRSARRRRSRQRERRSLAEASGPSASAGGAGPPLLAPAGLSPRAGAGRSGHRGAGDRSRSTATAGCSSSSCAATTRRSTGSI